MADVFFGTKVQVAPTAEGTHVGYSTADMRFEFIRRPLNANRRERETCYGI